MTYLLGLSSWRLGSPLALERDHTRPADQTLASEHVTLPERTHLFSLQARNGRHQMTGSRGGTYAERTRRTSASERKPPLPEMALK